MLNATCEKKSGSISAARAGRQKLKAKIDHLLLEDSSYEGAETVRDLLDQLGDDAEHIKAKMQKLFSRREAQSIMDRLKGRLSGAADERYKWDDFREGVKSRLNRFAEFCGGRNTWRFQYGVDPEDLIDERDLLPNIPQDTGELQEALNAALIRVRAFYGAYVYGRPYIREGLDRELADFRKIAR